MSTNYSEFILMLQRMLKDLKRKEKQGDRKIFCVQNISNKKNIPFLFICNPRGNLFLFVFRWTEINTF